MFSLFHYCIPLENGQVLNLSRFDPPLTRFLRAKLDRNWPRGSSAEDENGNSYNKNGQILTRKAHESSTKVNQQKVMYYFIYKVNQDNYSK